MTDSPQITVSYERKFSDGNYGSEGMSLTWTGPHDQAYNELAAALRIQVLAFLSSSASERVAAAATQELKDKPLERDLVAATLPDDDQESLPF